MDPTLATTLAQFGVAGLIGWMWLTERRAAESRNQQLSEAHTQLTQDRTTITALLKALEDNTRAITTLESTQRMLLESMNQRSSPKGEECRAA